MTDPTPSPSPKSKQSYDAPSASGYRVKVTRFVRVAKGGTILLELANGKKTGGVAEDEVQKAMDEGHAKAVWQKVEELSASPKRHLNHDHGGGVFSSTWAEVRVFDSKGDLVAHANQMGHGDELPPSFWVDEERPWVEDVKRALASPSK